jgi:hypothetical protein
MERTKKKEYKESMTGAEFGRFVGWGLGKMIKEEYRERGQEQILEDLLDKDWGRWQRKSTWRAEEEQRLEDMWNTDEKIERKSTGRAGQEQRLEDMWNKEEKIARKGTGRAGQEQRLEDMWNKEEKIARKGTGRAG